MLSTVSRRSPAPRRRLSHSLDAPPVIWPRQLFGRRGEREEVLVRDVELLAAERAHLLVAVRHFCAAAPRAARAGLLRAFSPKKPSCFLGSPCRRRRLASEAGPSGALSATRQRTVGGCPNYGGGSLRALPMDDGEASAVLRGVVLEFSGPPAASAGLAKTSERNQRQSCKFASGFMAASLLRGRQARLPIYELVRRL